MKIISMNEAKTVKAGWTCWLCGAHGWDKASGLRHAQLNWFHSYFMTP